MAHHVIAAQPGEPAGAREFATFEAGMHYVEETYLKVMLASQQLCAAPVAWLTAPNLQTKLQGQPSSEHVSARPEGSLRATPQVASGLGLCEAELSSCSVTDVLRGQHAALGAVGSSVVGGGDPAAADLPAAALARFVKVYRSPRSGLYPSHEPQAPSSHTNSLRSVLSWPSRKGCPGTSRSLPSGRWPSVCRTDR